MEKPRQTRKKQNGRSKSFTGASIASFLRSTVASFSSNNNTNGGRSSFNHRNAFSGPIAVSIVPPEARGRRRQPNSSGYRTPEPRSPKVSCIGQIKRNKSKRAAAKVNPACGKNGGACPLPPRPESAARCKPKGSLVKRVLFRRSRSRSSSSSRSSRDGSNNGRSGKGVAATATAPPAPAGGIGQMKRFTSGRAAFQDFDWREEETTKVHDHDDYDYEDEDDGFVAHSAPLVLGGGVVAAEPKKEVCLWRRRPIAPPTPLQLP